MTEDKYRDVVIIAEDARTSGFCGRGMTDWGRARGMTVKKMLAGEYTVGSMEDLNDAFANRIAAAARARAKKQDERADG